MTVRRLKQDLLNDDGTPRFPRRRVVMLEVEHPDSERQVHATWSPMRPLAQTGSAATVGAGRGGFRHDAAEEAPVLLAGGVPAHARGAPRDAARARRPEAPPTPTVLQRLFDDAANALDGEASEDGVGEASARRSTPPPRRSRTARPARSWPARRDDRLGARRWPTEDARTRRLLDWVEEHVKPRREVHRSSG